MSDEDEQDDIEIPHSALSTEALIGLAEAFVLREGTDYGEQVYTLEQKVDHVLDQLKQGEALIVYATATNSTDIVLRSDYVKQPKVPENH